MALALLCEVSAAFTPKMPSMLTPALERRRQTLVIPVNMHDPGAAAALFSDAAGTTKRNRGQRDVVIPRQPYLPSASCLHPLPLCSETEIFSLFYLRSALV